jgi:hypothetical protein
MDTDVIQQETHSENDTQQDQLYDEEKEIATNVNESKEDEHESKPYWCSWCFKKTDHQIMEKHYLSRNVYKCTDCKRLTLHCLKCKIGILMT